MKLPWMKFYTADWIADLGHHDIEIEGAWIRICSHIQRRGAGGALEMPASEWCRLLGRSEDDCAGLLRYVTQSNLGNVTESNGQIKVTCRRLEREAGQQAQGYNRVKKFRLKRKCNAKETPGCNGIEVRSKKLETDKETERDTDKNKRKDKGLKENQSPPIPYAEIVAYLNENTGASFPPGADKTQELIRVLWKKGYTLEQFQRVIDIKTKDWKGDPKMEQYLRPSTLFRKSKFEEYIGQAPKGKTMLETLKEITEEEDGKERSGRIIDACSQDLP